MHLVILSIIRNWFFLFLHFNREHISGPRREDTSQFRFLRCVSAPSGFCFPSEKWMAIRSQRGRLTRYWYVFGKRISSSLEYLDGYWLTPLTPMKIRILFYLLKIAKMITITTRRLEIDNLLFTGILRVIGCCLGYHYYYFSDILSNCFGHYSGYVKRLGKIFWIFGHVDFSFPGLVIGFIGILITLPYRSQKK